MCFVLVRQVAAVPISSTDNPDTSIGKERHEPGVHTINNANPYQGMTVTEGHGKYQNDVGERCQGLYHSGGTFGNNELFPPP